MSITLWLELGYRIEIPWLLNGWRVTKPMQKGTPQWWDCTFHAGWNGEFRKSGKFNVTEASWGLRPFHMAALEPLHHWKKQTPFFTSFPVNPMGSNHFESTTNILYIIAPQVCKPMGATFPLPPCTVQWIYFWLLKASLHQNARGGTIALEH
jgi:hypothetical protein